MKIICAGFPKTGTKSLAKALRRLGFKVHDFPDHFQYHLDEYAQAASGDIPDLIAMYSDVDAITDVPACYLWKELGQSFPEAKVILMERDSADSWFTSYQRTFNIFEEVLSKFWVFIGLRFTPSGRKLGRILDFIANQLQTEHGEEAMKIGYLDYNLLVKATVPQDKLLVYKVKQGWDPLCTFLGVDVPDVPFPRINVKSDMVGAVLQSVLSQIMGNEVIALFVLIVLAISACFFPVIAL